MLDQLRPLFALALKKALDDLEASIQSVIKEKCTAVHPAVEWRFRRAALKRLEARRLGQEGELEEIVFPEVYPLYGICDVRGSSEARNQACGATSPTAALGLAVWKGPGTGAPCRSSRVAGRPGPSRSGSRTASERRRLLVAISCAARWRRSSSTSRRRPAVEEARAPTRAPWTRLGTVHVKRQVYGQQPAAQRRLAVYWNASPGHAALPPLLRRPAPTGWTT